MIRNVRAIEVQGELTYYIETLPEDENEPGIPPELYLRLISELGPQWDHDPDDDLAFWRVATDVPLLDQVQEISAAAIRSGFAISIPISIQHAIG